MNKAIPFFHTLLLSLLLALPAGAADSTSFNPLPIPISATSTSVPVGTIIAWPSNSLPPLEGGLQKWAECNGARLPQANHPELLAAMGTTTLPNYRGIFLRGHGSQRHTNAYGTVIHSSGIIGGLQGDAIRNITGTLSLDESAPRMDNGVFAVAPRIGGKGLDSDSDKSKHSLQFDASRVVPTSSENRPINRAVMYLMRVLP